MIRLYMSYKILFLTTIETIETTFVTMCLTLKNVE